MAEAPNLLAVRNNTAV